MKYSKSILSLATIVALSANVYADNSATYLPLTSNTKDNAWIMFGVNGFSDGIATLGTTTGAFTLVDQISDSGADNLATQGFEDKNGVNMGSVQALVSGTFVVATTSTDTLYDVTQPVRTMYIAIEGSSTRVIKMTYNAVLEGRSIEVQKDGAGIVYRTKISQSATFNNPAIAKDTAAITTSNDLTKPEDVLAYDLSNSPVKASLYSKADHQGAAASDSAIRFYNYDAANSVWKIWDNKKVAVTGANSIVNFEKGKAYWGRMNDTTVASTTATARAGLVLGKSGSSEANASTYTGLTAPGWNMLSFDPAAHPDIRNSMTGLIATTISAFADTNTIKLVDETGNNSVTVTFRTGALGAESVAKTVNETIEAQKILGNIPESFNIKCFPTTSTTSYVFVSDKKFTLFDGAGSKLGDVTTLTGAKPIDSSTGLTSTITDYTDSAGATSLYGEYAMIVEPLVGTGSASNLDSTVGAANANDVRSAAVRFGTTTGTEGTNVYLADDHAATTLASATTLFGADTIFTNGKITAIGTDFSTANDMLILASDKPFYIKDNTFVRQYKVDTGLDGTDMSSGAANSAFTVKGANPSSIIPGNGDTATEVVAAINAQSDTGDKTKVYAIETAGTNTFAIVSAETTNLALVDANEATTDYFSAANETDLVTKGAIAKVLNISKLARENVILTKRTVTFTADAGDGESSADNALDITVGGVAITPEGTAIVAKPRTDATILTMLNSLVTKLNAALVTAGSAAFASHNYVSGYNDITKAIITIEGIDVSTVALTETPDTALAATVGAANADTGKLNVDAALITKDLKANAVYTPDYVNYGPLYTLKNAGYEAKVIVHPSTKLDTTPSTHWDHIDLTRDSADWLKRNEFNLFSVDNASGYWVYVDNYTNPNTLGYTNPTFTPSYTYTFNSLTNATTNTISGGSFNVEVSGVSAEKSNVKLLLGGNEIGLVPSNSTYSALLSEPETGLIAPQVNPIELGIFIADGVGESFTDTNMTQIDYDAPDAPTVVFSDIKTVAITDASSDVASYSIYEDYVPDDGTSLVQKLTPTEAAAYNVCSISASGYGLNKFKVIAIDGNGNFGAANISDVKSLSYLNGLKGATVLTHTQGDATSSVKTYSTTCVADANASKSGVEIVAQTAVPVRFSYIASTTGTINTTNELPITAYYAIGTSTTAVIKVDFLSNYTGNTFYVEYDSKLYSGTFVADRAAGDVSFGDPEDLTLIASDNKALQ